MASVHPARPDLARVPRRTLLASALAQLDAAAALAPAPANLYILKAQPSSATTSRHVACKSSTLGSRHARLRLKGGPTITSRGTHMYSSRPHYRVGPMYVKVGGTHTCSGGPHVGPTYCQSGFLRTHTVKWDPHIVRWGSTLYLKGGTYTCLGDLMGTHY
jgi:hypothetical protein